MTVGGVGALWFLHPFSIFQSLFMQLLRLSAWKNQRRVAACVKGPRKSLSFFGHMLNERSILSLLPGTDGTSVALSQLPVVERKRSACFDVSPVSHQLLMWTVLLLQYCFLSPSITKFVRKSSTSDHDVSTCAVTGAFCKRENRVVAQQPRPLSGKGTGCHAQ